MRSYLIAGAAALLALSSPAQVIKVRDFEISEPQDHHSMFAMAVTPSGDVLSLIAKDTGDWELRRIRDWGLGPAASDKLVLEGYFSKRDGKDLESLKVAVFVTKDGKYAVCIGEAQWLKRPNYLILRGRGVEGTAHADDAVTVVDLSTFRTVSSSRTVNLGLLEFHQPIRLDSEDRVFIDSASSGKPVHGSFVRLSVPSLTVGPTCTYVRVYDSAAQWHREATAADACKAALGGATSLEQYYQREFPRFERPVVCKGNHAQFCAWAGRLSADGKYGLAERVEGSDRILFPGWVVTHHSYIIFSTVKRSDIGEVKAPPDVSTRGMFGYYAGRDYLLLLRDGTRLTIYELRG